MFNSGPLGLSCQAAAREGGRIPAIMANCGANISHCPLACLWEVILSYIRINKHYIHTPYLWLGLVETGALAGLTSGAEPVKPVAFGIRRRCICCAVRLLHPIHGRLWRTAARELAQHGAAGVGEFLSAGCAALFVLGQLWRIDCYASNAVFGV